MFEGAHFCMACGSPMPDGSAPQPRVSPSRPVLELDLSWREENSPSVTVASDERQGASASGDDELVPDDEVEIEEVDEAEPAAVVHSSGQERAIRTLRQIRDTLIDLDMESRPRPEAIAVCRDVMESLDGPQEVLGPEAVVAWGELVRALGALAGKSFPESSELSGVKQKYEVLSALLPELGDFAGERRQRVEFIVRAILDEVPGMGSLDRGRLEAAGYGELEPLCHASLGDLEAAGLAPDLARCVAERVSRFKRRLDSVPPQPDRAAERKRLARLTRALREHNQALESLTRDWSRGSGSKRRRIRDARAETMSQVSLLLARLGELRVAERIERLPFERKAAELEGLLSALDDTHLPTHPAVENEHA